MELPTLNSSIIGNIGNFLVVTASNFSNKAIEIIKTNVSEVWMTNLFVLILAFGFVFIAGKVTQKLAKLGLYILGIILIVGIVMNIII